MQNHIPSTNPADNYSHLGSVEATSESEILELVKKSRQAQIEWSNTSLESRIEYLRELYRLFDSHQEKIAQSVAQEMGMPIRGAGDEVGYGLSYFAWYLENAQKYLSPEETFENDTELHTVYYEAKGVIAAITPWNYPFMLCIWACIQPLLAGNTVIWKISKEVILTGKLIGDIITASNLPVGIWGVIYGDGKLGDFLTSQDIDGITFTGSTEVGKGLAKKAFEKGIPALMELGGSAPGIVCEDADIDAVLETIYYMRFSNSGQMCDGLKRLIVHTSRYEELIIKLSERLLSKKIGNPLDESTDIGPLVSDRQLDIITAQFDDAISKGAIIESELTVNDGFCGAFYAPKILSGITRHMRIWREEVFGPILPVMQFDTLEDAIKLANDTIYGLGAYVFTENRDTFEYLSHHIQSGMIQLNTVNYCIPSDPFGGYKASGVGREHGKWGFYEFCNVKVLSIPK